MTCGTAIDYGRAVAERNQAFSHGKAMTCGTARAFFWGISLGFSLSAMEKP